MAAFAIVWEKQSRAKVEATQQQQQQQQHQHQSSSVDFDAARISDSQDKLLRFATSLTSLRCDDLIKLVKKVILQPPHKPEPTARCQTCSLQVGIAGWRAFEG